jgi:hypothetical protein
MRWVKCGAAFLTPIGVRRRFPPKENRPVATPAATRNEPPEIILDRPPVSLSPEEYLGSKKLLELGEVAYLKVICACLLIVITSAVRG